MTKSVPKGSILCQVLFKIYIKEIASSVSNCKFHLYANDTVLLWNGDSLQSALENSLLQHTFII